MGGKRDFIISSSYLGDFDIKKNVPYKQDCISFNAYMNSLSYFSLLMPRQDDGKTTDLIRLDL